MAASIIIKRKSAFLRDRLRRYKVLIDGEERGRIRNGKTVSFDVAPGRHTLRVTIDWAGSPEATVSLEEGDTVSFIVAPGGDATSGLSDSIRSPSSYLALYPESWTDHPGDLG